MTDTEIFKAAVKLPIEQRAAFLERACDRNPARQREIDSLLQAHDQPGSFLNEPAARIGATIDAAPIAERPGAVIGPYKLMEQIGEGGMGLVFVAEQQQPIRRKVALKIIKPGMDSRQVIARFEAERQALAMMDHLNIARVFDAATTESGRPYFVMELVHGVPITEYCDANKLTPRQRLELFIPVCHAIQHAHQKGVIHRDIKPSNILVTMYDDKPVPKVIDFGVAKAIEQRLTERTVYTQFGTLVGTFEYMSPEQAEMNAFGVDTRSDVYSLGVLLYELLTGTTPLERRRLREAGFGEIVRLIKEEEALRPSVRLSTSGALAKVAAARKTDPAKLSRLVRGELDWVVMRCLEKDRTRRYDTANGLARDLERFLHDEPVEACPPSIGYRLRKSARKHKAALAVAAGFAAMLLVGFGLVTWKWQDERVARADADGARRDAEDKTREVLAGAERMNAATAAMNRAQQYVMFGQWGPAEDALNRAITFREDHAQVWMNRGDLYGRMGLWELAAADYARSVERQAPEVVRHWYFHALLQLLTGNEPGYRAICAKMLSRFGDTNDGFTRGHLIRACALMPGAVGDYDALLTAADAQDMGPRGGWVGLYFRGLGRFRAGRYDKAIRDLRDSLAKSDTPARAMNYPVLAMALHYAGQAEAARQELNNSHRELRLWAQRTVVVTGRLAPWESWWDWAEFQLFDREAHLLIEKTPPPDEARLNVLRGRAFAALGRSERAAAEYTRAAQLAPEVAEIRFEWFRMNADARRWVEADAVLNGLKSLRPGDPHVHLDAFRAFAANGRWDRAAAEHQAAIRLGPSDAKILLERYRFHAERGETALADAAYASATNDRADDIAFRIKCGDACAEFGQWDKARAEYARILDAEIFGDGDLNRNTWLRFAILQLYFGDVEGYRRTCRRLIDRHGPNAPRITALTLARICLLHPNPGVPAAEIAALTEPYARAGTKTPEFALPIVALAAARAGKPSPVFARLQQAAEKSDSGILKVALAVLCQQRGDCKEARRLMAKLPTGIRRLELPTGGHWDWSEGQLYYRQAEAMIQSERWSAIDALFQARQWADAGKALDELLKPEHQYGPDWRTRAICHAQLGRWKDAVADFARAEALAPDDHDAAIPHGSACLRMGDIDGYRSLCRRVLERQANSPDPTTLNNAAWLCALAPEAAGEATTALALVEKAIAKHPYRQYLHTRGCILYRVGRFDDAVKQLNDLIAQPGYAATALDWLFLAMAHQKPGQKEQARKYLDQSLVWLAANSPRPWQPLFELERFRAEAEALIK